MTKFPGTSHMCNMALSLVLMHALLMSSPAPCSADWLHASLWDEGNAEVCLYRGKIQKYGKLRDSSLDVITVREHFDPDKLVKTRPAPGKRVLCIMKTNITRRVRTGVYEYVQMASAFMDRDTGGLVKLSCVSSEWCGNSFALLENRHGRRLLTISNYFDDQGKVIIKDPVSRDTIFYDALLLHLRQDLKTIMPGHAFPLACTLLSNKPGLQCTTCRIVHRRTKTISHNNRRHQLIALTLKIGDQQEIFEFLDTPERTLYHWENNQGAFYTLWKSMFLDYWNKNQPGDEALIQP